MTPVVSALETYLPLVSAVAFLGGWGLAMLTGLMFRTAL
jgi:hypothetical protein